MSYPPDNQCPEKTCRQCPVYHHLPQHLLSASPVGLQLLQRPFLQAQPEASRHIGELRLDWQNIKLCGSPHALQAEETVTEALVSAAMGSRAATRMEHRGKRHPTPEHGRHERREVTCCEGEVAGAGPPKAFRTAARSLAPQVEKLS